MKSILFAVIIAATPAQAQQCGYRSLAGMAACDRDIAIEDLQRRMDDLEREREDARRSAWLQQSLDAINRRNEQNAQYAREWQQRQGR